ncbi:MAG: hypothetical protein QOE90_618 [Thermoplasmata archaeon]|jgi:hypothetical protein|nr:hypothetical protein [Thermoplasmata archaeon]
MRDDAVSNNAAVLMMIATVMGVASAVYLHVVYGADAPHGTIGLSAMAAGSDGRLRQLHVDNASANMTYQSVTIEMAGSPLKYDSSATGAGYCVAPKGGPCVQKDEWLPGDHKVTPGDVIRIQGPQLSGAKVDVLLDTRQAWEGNLAK